MSKEKQIEEMSSEIREAVNGCSSYWSEVIAEHLFEQGYRKQIIGEWQSELVKKCDWKGKKRDYYQPNSCSLCHEAVVKRTPFCPNCGARMRKEDEGK